MRRIIAVINLHFIVATRKWMAGTGSFKINKPLIENNISILFIDCSTWKKTAYYDPINNHHLTHRDDACKRDTSYHISTCTQQALTLAFRVVVTRGIMKYFKFSFALFGHYQSGRLFPTTFVSPQPKTEPRWSEYSNRKKRTTWRKPILLEYWWILQIVFPAYRFVWSKCSTNNGILNAIGRAKCSQKKKTPIQFHSQSRLRTSKARVLSTHVQQKTTEGKKQWNNFPHADIIYFSHFNSRCKYSKYLDSQPNTLFVSAYIKRLGWIG